MVESNKYLKDTDSEWYKNRITGVIYIVILAFAVLWLRLFFLQIIEGEKYRSSSNNQKVRKQSIEAYRGIIFDRNGIPIVENRPSFNLSIILKDAAPVHRTLQKLSDYINIPYSDLLDSVSKKRDRSSNPIILKYDISWDMLAIVEVYKFDLPGVSIDVKSRRNYIYGEQGAHIQGYLGEISSIELNSGLYPECRSGDYVGKMGIEREYDSYLRGKRGEKLVEVNALGQVVRNLNVVEAQPGHNVYLTIDWGLQVKGEELMREVVGGAVVMDVDNGEVLAMINSPSFDPNLFVGGISRHDWLKLTSNPFRPMENKVIRGQYPPASTYKIITAVAALEENAVDENTTFYCPGFMRFGDRNFRCWKRGGHGTVNLVKALADSCDVYFYQAGLRLGVDKIAHYAHKFGLGQTTGIRLDREEAGLIPTSQWKLQRLREPWHRGETLSIAIGQGYNLTTPLQLAVMTSAMANGGKLYTPKLIKKIKTASGSVVDFSEHPNNKSMPDLNIKQSTMELVQKGLLMVVTEGTGRTAQIKGINVYGKTGTAQVVSKKKNDFNGAQDLPDHLKSHGLFVAWANINDRNYTCSVIIEHGESGSRAAAPIAKALFEFIAQQ